MPRMARRMSTSNEAPAMTGVSSDSTAHKSWTPRLPFFYGWVNLAVAVLALVATLPGRTWGLGLITNPLLKDLGLSRAQYADINLYGTLLGAAFCLPAGWLIDRIGARLMMVLVTLGL